MCRTCDAMGINEADCRICGEFFLWVRWDVREYGPTSEGAPVDPSGESWPDDALSSPLWIHQAFDPRSCPGCAPSGYRHPLKWADNPAGNAWIAGSN